MRTKLCSLAVLIAPAAGAAIWLAPIAMAQNGDEPSCTTMGTDTECQSPGNVQINDSPAVLDPEPQYPYWEGGDLAGSDDHGGPGHR
jgi:hypothetical protein